MENQCRLKIDGNEATFEITDDTTGDGRRRAIKDRPHPTSPCCNDDARWQKDLVEYRFSENHRRCTGHHAVHNGTTN